MKNAAILRFIVRECNGSDMTRIEKALLEFASDLSLFMRDVKWEHVDYDKETLASSLMVGGVYRMAKPHSFCCVCLAEDTCWIEALKQRVLLAHPVLGPHLKDVEIEIGMPMHTLPTTGSLSKPAV